MSDRLEFIEITGQITNDEIREFLQEILDCDVSRKTAMFFGLLAVTTPTERLCRNLAVVTDKLSMGKVTEVLIDGITHRERDVLLELEDRGISYGGRLVAHSLLNLKERWIYTKTMSGMFSNARDSQAYLVSEVV